ncbi:baeRF7 domain-containing protein [Dyadobacter chenhuakuii]|uniref:Uncharacterized protein n=1 Tax=Dyadobacter chenhuakuii TaxID=2909339 RepID=A0A9X1QFU3_9BACT|nr:hypothetical protein [Dyadobacter chenhuakuii]MCF2499563.1 hypothetical protein [Dyadobacter chenhuakuii]
MGKDQSGGFHPPKGKPSTINKVEGLGISNAPAEKLDEFLELDNKYVEDDLTLDPSLPVRHPNRNTSKGENSFKGKENKPESDKTAELSIDDQNKTEPEELPQVLDKELFVELASYQAPCCVTMYIPTHKSGVEVNEKKDLINFKNALQDVSKRLADREIPQAVIEQMLTPGYELLQNDTFWASMNEGLAVFISEGYFRYIKMPVAPENELMCEKSFYVSPLIPIMASKEYFFLLVISKQKCKLFRADAFGMEYIDVPDLPEEMMDVKRISEKDASTVRVANSSGGGANFHGMGGGNPDEKANIATYFEHVDDILYKQILHTENVPLLLAGVEYLIPIYKSVCDYHNVCSESITGSHEHDDKNELYKLAKEIMLPYFEQPLDKALTIFANQSATELTSSSLNEIIPAAYYGRISHIFVKKANHIWGTFDENSNELTLGDLESADSEDLLDEALIKTIQNGGEVYVLDEDKMPAESPVAAVFRY